MNTGIAVLAALYFGTGLFLGVARQRAFLRVVFSWPSTRNLVKHGGPGIAAAVLMAIMLGDFILTATAWPLLVAQVIRARSRS